MKWDNLTMSQKQALMKIYVNNGVTNLDEIVNHYNRFSEGGSKETVESPNTIMYSRIPRELAGNVVNTRPVPNLITMTEVPRIGVGINIPFKELIDRFVLGSQTQNNNINVINTDSINRPISYITRPSRINRFDDGGYTEIVLPEVEVTPRTSALAYSREAVHPNKNFLNAQDMNFGDRLKATFLANKLTDSLFDYDPHTCLNTVTGFYNPKATVASNPKFVENPEKFGFTEIPQKEVLPGDIIILSRGDNHPKHAVMFDSVAEKGGIHNGYIYEAGDTLVNYSNGGRNLDDYRLQGPLSRFDDPKMSGGDFSGIKRYYKYIGKNKK